MQWVHFISGAEAGQTLEKDPAIARRLITIGVCRLPTPTEIAEAEAAKVADGDDGVADEKKARRGKRGGR